MAVQRDKVIANAEKLVAKGKIDAAIKEYERVLELRPNDPETHYNLGVLYDDYIKDREKALYHYQKYLAINPTAAMPVQTIAITNGSRGPIP